MPSFHFKQCPEGMACIIGITPDCFVGAIGDDKPDALAKAADAAGALKKAVDSDPLLKAAATSTPYGAAAYTAISLAADMLKSGTPTNQIATAIGPKVAEAVSHILSLF